MHEFGWTEFVFIYSLIGDDEKCSVLRDDLQDLVSAYDDLTMAYSYQITDDSEEGLTKALKIVAARGRIILPCFPEGNQRGTHRRFMIAAVENGFSNDEFIYIFPALRSRAYDVSQLNGTYRPPWVLESGPSEDDNIALKGFKKSMFICDMQGQGASKELFQEFSQEVIRRMGEPPYNCIEECKGSEYTAQAATYSGQLHDAVYAWGRAMNKTLTSYPDQYKNGTFFLKTMEQNFTGISGVVTINEIGIRDPTVYVMVMDKNNSGFLAATITVDDLDNGVANMTKFYTNEKTEVWHNWNGKKPKTEPECGFTGTKCPPNVLVHYLGWFITAFIVILIAIVGAIAALIMMIRAKQKEVERQNSLWQIPFNTMKPISKKSKGEHSMRSISSGPSTISNTKSMESEINETRHYLFFTIQNDYEAVRVAARKHNVREHFDKASCAELRALRQIDHPNLNRFEGLSLDAPQLLSVWRFCSRGSLADVIRKASIQMDGFFLYSLLKDIANGMLYIHNSPISHHGMLSSKTCLVNDRWQMKISDFGLRKIRINDQYSKEDLLWTAPEHLRNNDLDGSKEGDVYSMGIIASEVITRKSVFDIENRSEDADELIYMLKKGGLKGPRPSLEHDDTLEINPALLHLVRDCWTERPEERPTIKEIVSQLRGLNTNRNDNLMDHVFNVLESYASTLEDEVAERMKELVEEKKKSDLLLYRMLPKQVADKLKLGQTVEPETFDIVTLFFSDVVSFTTLASKCTPLQVVNLLNDLYTIFDGIIDQHDVYKVETIGDGYLCVSGLPHRNGKEHVRHIASMSLGFVTSLNNFRVPHLPTEQIRIRVGFHSGSVVAGVVGLTMPRYCLFGDAVNTASRMESNSKPGQIHISFESNELLMDLGGFVTEPRGEVLVKGKGVMQTFWLLSMSEAGAPILKSNMK